MNVLESVSRMSTEELNQVVDSVKLRRTYLARQQTKTLSPGDKVTFDGGRKHGVINGTVSKVNIKTVVVVSTSPNTTWKVSVGLLTKV